MSTVPPTAAHRRPIQYAKSPVEAQKVATPNAPVPGFGVAPRGNAIASEDVELQERIAAYFAKLPVAALRELRIEVRETVVTLLGQVANDYERQLAQHYVRRIPGVVTLVDNIAVDEPPPPMLGLIGKLRARVGSARMALITKLENCLPANPAGEAEPRGRRRQLTGAPSGRRRHSRLTHPLSFAAVALGMLLIAVSMAWSGPSRQLPEDRLSTFPVKGSVVIGKEPPKGAFVVFHPLSGSATAPHPAGFVTKFGDYSLTTYELGDGAPPGDYSVTIEWNPPQGNNKYQPLSQIVTSRKTTKLRAHVTAKGNVVSQFKL